MVCVGDEARWYAESFPGEVLLYETPKRRLRNSRGSYEGATMWS
jgi:hypothetical protein